MPATDDRAAEGTVPQTGTRAGPWLAVVLIASLALRLAFAVFWPGSVEWSDAKGYHELALKLLHEGAFPTVFYAPGYPVFVAAIYAFFGERPLPVLIVQSVIGTLGVWVTYLTGIDALGRGRHRIALLAAALFGLSPGVAYYSAWLLREGVLLLLIPLLAWFCLRTLQRTWWYGLPLGLTAGALAYVRIEGGLLVALMLLVGVLHRRWRWRAVGGGLLAGAVAAAIAAPWISYCSRTRGYANMQVSLGPNLFARTWHLSPTGAVEPDLRQKVIDGVRELGLTSKQQRTWEVTTVLLRDLRLGDLQGQLELYRRMGAIGWENIRQQPLKYLGTFPRNIWLVLGGEPFRWWPGRWSPSVSECLRDHLWNHLALKVFHYLVWPAVVVPFALIGLAWALKRRDAGAWPLATLLLPAALSTLVVLAVVPQGEARYRLPYDGFLYLAMAVGWAVAARRIRPVPA